GGALLLRDAEGVALRALRDGKRGPTLLPAGVAPRDVACTRDGRRAIFVSAAPAGSDTSLYTVIALDGDGELGRFQEAEPRSVALAGDASMLAIARTSTTGESVIALFDVDAGREVGVVAGRAPIALDVSASRLAARTSDASKDEVVVYDMKTRQPIWTQAASSSGRLEPVDFAPDGRTLVVMNGENIEQRDVDDAHVVHAISRGLQSRLGRQSPGGGGGRRGAPAAALPAPDLASTSALVEWPRQVGLSADSFRWETGANPNQLVYDAVTRQIRTRDGARLADLWLSLKPGGGTEFNRMVRTSSKERGQTGSIAVDGAYAAVLAANAPRIAVLAGPAAATNNGVASKIQERLEDIGIDVFSTDPAARRCVVIETDTPRVVVEIPIPSALVYSCALSPDGRTLAVRAHEGLVSAPAPPGADAPPVKETRVFVWSLPADNARDVWHRSIALAALVGAAVGTALDFRSKRRRSKPVVATTPPPENPST
ncbi:MAG: hypothetical protein KGM43_10270, partial [Planctomycetota bacterium]|nr:hypothetical protein [Planctomycetota bacterium]